MTRSRSLCDVAAKGLFACSLIVAACDPPPTDADASSADFDARAPAPTDAPGDALAAPDALPDAATTDATVPSVDASVDIVHVSHAREMRGVWLSSVSNLDFPSRTGLTPERARAELTTVVERVERAGLNAIFFQVRPESDALYVSSLEPWSRFLTGTQGRDPGYDPLRTLLDLAHARGIEVHAWLNPYRGMSSASATTAPNHVTRTLSAHAIRYGSSIVMDPGAPAVRAHVVAVIRDLTDRYPDLDGVHFDDYFYPYPDADGTPFPDSASYDAYRRSGGALSLGDWRRENVNTLVREVQALLLERHPSMRFGISPFGIYRPGMPPGIRGLDAYATIYCDAVRWMREDWLDYVAPQLYWPTTPEAQAFEPLLGWWGMQADGREHVFAGHALYRLGSSSAWTLAEMETQIGIVRRMIPMARVRGSLFFRYRNLADDLLGVATAFGTRIYAERALPPPISRLVVPPPPPTSVSVGSMRVVTIAHPEPETLRFWAFYRLDGTSFALTHVRDARSPSHALEPGTWVVSAIAAGGLESPGVRFVVE